MHIVILGDSWGEPNWRSPQPGYTEQGHITHRLRSWGARVSNYSISGGSNHSTWWNWRNHGSDPADWIIWFHTDIARDFNWPRLHGIDRDQPWSLESTLDATAASVYQRCQSVWRERGSSPLILVEAQSCRYRPLFDRYFQPQHVIEDWRAQLVGRPMPKSQIIGPMVAQGSDFFRNCRDTREQQSLYIDQVETIMAAMNSSDLFLDNCHPGDQAHGQLFDRVIDLLGAQEG